MSVRTLIATIAASTVFAVLAASCSTSTTKPSSTTQQPTGGRSAPTLKPGNYQFSIAIGTAERSYLVHVPDSFSKSTPRPLVVSLHAAGSNAAQQESYTQLDASADRRGFIAMYPNGTPFAAGNTTQLAWDAGSCCGLPATNHVDDVAFILGAIDDLARRTPIDQRRVYVAGYSNGAMMAYAMAAEASGRVAAVASVAGTVTVPAVRPSRPVPVIEFHSLDDPVVRWGGIPGLFPPVAAGIAEWVSEDHCAPVPHTAASLTGAAGSPDAGLSATAITYSRCEAGARVVLWRLTGSGHVWPGRTAVPNLFGGAPLGRPTTLVDANETIWRFFSAYELPK